MPAANVDAIAAKYNAAEAEAAVDSPSAPPATGESAVASASADVEAPVDGSPASPEATNAPALDHGELQAKLAHDRKLRAAKELKKKAKEHEAATAAARKEAEEMLAKAKLLGKDQKWIDRIKAEGGDPRQVFREMQEEALKAGTPEARLEAELRSRDEVIAELKKRLDDGDAEKRAAEEARKEAEAERAKERTEHRFVAEFQRAVEEPAFASLREEYDDDQLLDIADTQRRNPAGFRAWAKRLAVPLTSADGSFTMREIFHVMHAAQSAHRERLQRRTQSAAATTSGAPKQGAAATNTVNGTVERKTGTPTTIGNALASERAAEVEALAGMTKEQKRAYLEKKYPQTI